VSFVGACSDGKIAWPGRIEKKEKKERREKGAQLERRIRRGEKRKK
jgi:hypothetical protein